MKILEENRNKIDFRGLSFNPNPEAIKILKENRDKIDWHVLSSNPGAIKLIEANQNKIIWDLLSGNPSIFELDYNEMKKNNQDMYEELIKEVMKPSRVFTPLKI